MSDRATTTEEGLPEGWVLAKLADITSRVPAVKPQAEPGRTFGYVDISAIDPEAARIDPAKLRTFSGKDAPARARRPIVAGDVLFSNVRTNLRNVAVVEEGLAAELCSTGFTVLRSNGAVLPRYLLRAVLTDDFTRRISGTQAGTHYPATTEAQVLEERVSVAPLSEQRRIVEAVERLLAGVSKAKQRLGRVSVLLKRARQAVLAAACSGRLTEAWRAANPLTVAGLLAGLGTSPCPGAGTEIPPTWAWVPFGMTVVNHDGRRVAVKASERERRRGEYPYYGASGIIDTIDDFLFDGELLLVAEDGANLLSRSTPVAFSARGKLWVNNHAHVVEPRSGVLLAYLEAYLNAVDLQEHVTGSAQPKLTQSALHAIPVALPPIEEQAEIVRVVNDVLALAGSVERRVRAAMARADQLPQVILAKAFSGELVPTEAELARAEGRT